MLLFVSMWRRLPLPQFAREGIVNLIEIEH